MSLTQYAARLLALRAEFRTSNRAVAFLLEVLRSATFAVIMPVIEEIRLRLIGPHASA